MPESTRIAGASPADLAVLLRLLREQRVGVLSTFDGACPYANILAFTATENLDELLLATPRASRKADNLLRFPKAAFLADDRTGPGQDFADASAVTAIGDIRIIPDIERPGLLALYTRRHPSLEEFARSPETLFLALGVSSYVLVRNFSRTVEIRPPVSLP